MTHFQRVSILTASAMLLGAAAFGQSVISVHSGLIHYSEGDVLLDGKQVQQSGIKFQDMKDGQVLDTQEGRAEVLLTPGVVLWMAENSSIRMISNKLAHTKVEVVSGSALVECAELSPNTQVTMQYKDSEIEFGKKGMLRIDSEPASLKVYSGEAVVTKQGQSLTLKDGKMTLLSNVLAAEKFDNKVGDSFYRWAARRDGAMAAANLAAAKSADKNAFVGRTGMWGWNSLMGMYSYIPYSGRYVSPFGFGFFSPGSVLGVYDAYYYGPGYANYGGGGYRNTVRNSGFDGSSYNSNLGYSTASRGSAAYNSTGPVSSAPAAAAVAAPVSTAGRGGDMGGGASRGSSGGGRGGR